MSRYIGAFILFLFSAASSLCQVPGYMGKKFIFEIGAQGLPAVGYFVSDEKFLDLNIRYSLGVDYVLTKRLCVGASIQQTNDVVFFKKHTNLSFLHDGYEEPQEYKSAANFYGLNYGLHLKIFSFKSSGSIAPFGRYAIVEYLINNIEITDDGRYYASEKKNLNQINTATFVLGIGSQKIFFNRIIIGVCMKFGLNGYGLMSLDKEERPFYDEITRVGSSKMFSDYLINVGLNLGFLAF